MVEPAVDAGAQAGWKATLGSPLNEPRAGGDADCATSDNGRYRRIFAARMPPCGYASACCARGLPNALRTASTTYRVVASPSSSAAGSAHNYS